MAEVETTRDGAVLTITLNRPDVLNAFTADMHRELVGAFKEARDPGVRAVVVTGAGRGFCVGQDLNEFGEAARDIAGRLRRHYHPTILAVRELEKPVLAAVNGPAAGAGLSFACACDLRLAAESATFVPAFINIGLVPDMGGTFFVTRLLGPARAFEWMTSGPRLSAAEALEWRLVVNDDLQRNRLTVFFRLILAIPLLLWAVLWAVIAVLAYIVNWFATLFMGQSPEGLHNFLATFLRYTTHVRAYTLLVADPYP